MRRASRIHMKRGAIPSHEAAVAIIKAQRVENLKELINLVIFAIQL